MQWLKLDDGELSRYNALLGGGLGMARPLQVIKDNGQWMERVVGVEKPEEAIPTIKNLPVVEGVRYILVDQPRRSYSEIEQS